MLARAVLLRVGVCLGFLAVALTPGRAGAQVSPYGIFSLAHYSGIGVGNGTLATQSGGITALGGTFGAFGDFPGVGPIRAGIDARVVIGNSANSTIYGNKVTAGLVGLHIDGSGLRHTMVIPYGQFEIGGGSTNNGTSTSRSGSFAYQVQFGADFPTVVHNLSGRVEYGAGQFTSIGNTNHTLQTFGAGLVFRLQ